MNVDNLALNFEKIFGMKKLLLLACLFISSALFSQFYYNDIITNLQGSQRYQLLMANKINKVIAISLDGNDQLQSDFLLQEIISFNNNQTTLTSKIASGKTSVIQNWYQKGKISKMIEASNNVNTEVNYSYDENGSIKIISSNTFDTAFQSESSEVHIWTYNNKHQPQQMWKIKNKTDSVLVDFVYDEEGNLIEEHWHKKNIEQEVYYYYYNDKKQLTDIVRFNKKALQLLPDYLFEYDAQNRVTQMTQVLAANSNYLVWHYTYNTKGLKQEETCSNKQKELIGKIEYKYE